jgi:beta-glucanase (GH16 family)
MLKLLFLLLYSSGILFAINLNSSMPDSNYKLVWSDEFNGNELDSTKWNYRYLGKRKLGYNTEDSIKVSNGTLKIVAYKEGSRYCSGMISTQDRFESKYGYYEMRAKIPKAIGLQTEFWIQSPLYGKIIGDPANAGSEIDIM